MAKTTKKKETAAAPVVTRAEKKDAVKNVIREILAVKPYKHNELLDAAAKLYTERFGGEETENVNDVKGRIGSVLDIMKKESDVAYEGGTYALKARLPLPPAPSTEEKPAETPKKTRAKKVVKEETQPQEIPQAVTEERLKKTAKRKTKKTATETPVEEKMAEEKPAETPKKTRAKKGAKQEPQPQEIPQAVTEESPKKTAKKKTKKAVTETPVEEKTAEEKPAEIPQPQPQIPVEKAETERVQEVKQEASSAQAQVQAQAEEKGALVVKPKGEVAKKEVMDVSFLLGGKPTQEQPKKPVEKPAEAAATTATEKPVEKPAETPKQAAEKVEPPTAVAEKPQEQPKKQEPKKPTVAKSLPIKPKQPQRQAEKPLTADEKLREAFLKRLRSLGGDYFEYYSVYLLERYSMKNGRRLESLKISGGDHDGGIDGEIELTDRFGFKETIYIQSKNWNPEKGDEKLWVVGETLLQQFLGACACRQAKDGKQSCRGIFVTTSRFTPDAKRVLETMADKLVGYDGNDVYEAAKECAFGLVKKNGEWALDERLLSGTKAFFNML